MKFIKYTTAYNEYIQQYVLTDDQLLYTASPKDAVDELDNERRAILAFDDDLFVNFFVLNEGSGPKQFLGSEHSILLCSFSMDNRFQGKGYAKNDVLSALNKQCGLFEYSIHFSNCIMRSFAN